jgi:ParB-like chromosome segregation protein Spo0J
VPRRPIEYRKISEPKRHPKNVRTHPAKQIHLLVKSIKQFGFTNPILIDEKNVILAGHARLLAAQKADLNEVPVVVLRGLSEAEKRAYVLADNKIAELAGYNRSALSVELQELSSLLGDNGLDLALTGFEPAEIDALFADLVDPETQPGDDVPPIATAAVSRKGDLWLAGDNRLLCGDSRNVDYGRLIGRERAAMVFTDPPYNLSIPKAVGRGRTKHRDFAMASGEMPSTVFTEFLVHALTPAAEHSIDGALHYICMDCGTCARCLTQEIASTAS